MCTYEDFKESLLPGNYALTKSMELTKVKSSGTLWYTKKFIVWYYYVFLSSDLLTREYINKVNDSFSKYINGLDEEVKKEAWSFFYPNIESINVASEKFKSFSSFVGNFEFDNLAQKEEHYQKARKCYFMMLMDSGGQTGVKMKLKEYVQSINFVYSRDNMINAMIECAIDVCCENINGPRHKITDNSIKHLVSDDAIYKINSLDTSSVIEREKIRTIIENNPKDTPNFVTIENDMVAFIRNERQILYYYGYFHSKSSGAKDFEFSSLTPVGDLSIKANALEFQAIWEHQKIKMISQPPTTTINDVNVDNPNKFAISYTPYIDIIGGILRRKEITLEEYKYVISRRKHSFVEENWAKLEGEIIDKMPEIKCIIQGFSRSGDVNDEDGRKELLKYILGIRGDLLKDGGTNNLQMCSFANQTVTLTSFDRMKLLYDIYTKVNDYKIQKYENLFERCEGELRRRYIAESHNETESINAQVKIDWDLYNIRIDKIIMLSVLFVISAISCNVLNGADASDAELQHIYDYFSSKFPTVLKSLGIKSAKKVRDEFRKIVWSLKAGSFEQYFVEKERDSEILADYKTDSSSDLLKKIEKISAEGDRSEEKERNMNLIKLIKSYYMKVYLNKNNTLKCECCGADTFITEKEEPFLEFHHLIPFKEADGPDHYLNLFALCPNCHRMIHHVKIDKKEDLFNNLNGNNYLGIRIADRLKELKNNHILESYHLEYLLAQKALTEEQYNEITT